MRIEALERFAARIERLERMTREGYQSPYPPEKVDALIAAAEDAVDGLRYDPDFDAYIDNGDFLTALEDVLADLERCLFGGQR
jgi:hypothetical protein